MDSPEAAIAALNQALTPTRTSNDDWRVDCTGSPDRLRVHETSHHATDDARGSRRNVRAGTRATAVARGIIAAGRGGEGSALAVAAGADVLVEPETRHRSRWTGRLHARLRSREPRVALRRDLPVHIHRLQIFSAFARTSSGADHHRIVLIAAFGLIKNDYDDYLGTGQPLKTDDDLKALAGRYLFRVKGDWFIGGQGSAANYQVLGATAEDDLVLETLGVRGFESAGVGVTLMHDSRDNEDMPTTGWFLNLNNIAYREALGGAESFDAYRVDLKTFWKHGGGHVLAVRQYNWLTSDAPAAAQATVILRGYKQGQYLSSNMSSLEVEERWSFNARWGATLFGGAAGLYGDAPAPLERSVYPTIGAGLQFVIKPKERMNVNLEYVQGIEDNRGVYLKLGYAW